MRKENITTYQIDEDAPRDGGTDWEYLRAMTEEEAYQNALDDPDAQPMTESELSGMRHVPDVRRIREALSLSQEEFAKRFGLSIRSVMQWEEGRSAIDAAARTLLHVIATDPEAVVRALRRAG